MHLLEKTAKVLVNCLIQFVYQYGTINFMRLSLYIVSQIVDAWTSAPLPALQLSVIAWDCPFKFGSHSVAEQYYFLLSGSGSDFWQVTVPVLVPGLIPALVPTPYLDHKSTNKIFFNLTFLHSKLFYKEKIDEVEKYTILYCVCDSILLRSWFRNRN